MIVRSAESRRPSRNRRGFSMEALEARELLATFTVTNVNDDGPGSLRQAIVDSNSTSGPNLIQFGIGSGPKTIIPQSPLPTISNLVTIDATTQPGFAGAPIVEIDGSQIFYPGSTPPSQVPDVTGLVIAARSTVRGLVINRFTGNGILIESSTGSVIAGNYIGLNLAGDTPLGNRVNGVGIVDSRNNVIGGSTAADRNVISGNGSSGVQITTVSGQARNGGNVVQGNYIGTDATGTLDAGNQFDGVTVNTTGNVIGGTAPGTGNLIANNGGSGVDVEALFFSFNQTLATTILSNPIYDNGFRAINLGFLANDPIYSSSLFSAYQSGGSTYVEGELHGAPSTTFRVQVFSNPDSQPSGFEEGRTLVGTLFITTDDSGDAEFTLPLPGVVPSGQSISMTATNPNLNATSEFFGSVVVATSPRADVSVTMSAGPPEVFVGSPLTYYVNIFNSGPSNATNVTLTDVLPGGVGLRTVDAPGGTVSTVNGVVTVTYDSLAPQNYRFLQITVIPSTIGTLTNTVAVRSDQTDAHPDDNEATVKTAVLANPNPAVVIDQNLTVTQNAITSLVLSFNQPLDAAQATNPINYRLLTGDQPGLFNQSVPLNPPAYDAASSILTLTPTQPLQLGRVYRLVINGEGSAGVTDLAGDLIIGNTTLGAQGPYVWEFSRGAVPQPQLAVADQRLVVGRSSINGLVLTFNRPLDPDQATNPINYAVTSLGTNGRRPQKVSLLTPAYDAGSQTVTLTPTGPLQLGRPYQLTINGEGSAGVVDESGNLLLGNTDVGPQGPYVWNFSRGYVPKPSPRPRSRPNFAARTPGVRLVETTTSRRVLSGPGTNNALPPLAESHSTQNSIDTNPA